MGHTCRPLGATLGGLCSDPMVFRSFLRFVCREGKFSTYFSSWLKRIKTQNGFTLSSVYTIYLRSTPHPVTVTTRIITFLVGNPYKPSFATVAGWGVDPRYIPKNPDPSQSNRIEGSNPILRIGMDRGNPILGTYLDA